MTAAQRGSSSPLHQSREPRMISNTAPSVAGAQTRNSNMFCSQLFRSQPNRPEAQSQPAQTARK